MEIVTSFQPLVPWEVIIFAGGLAVVLVAICLWRGLPGGWLRALGAGMLIMALAGPVLRREDRQPLSNIVFVVADQTQSQKISTRPAQMKTALTALKLESEELDDFEFRWIEVQNDLEAQDSGSLILSELRRAALDVPANRIAGALVLSDGKIHDAGVLTRFAAPVHLLLTGQRSNWDRRVVIKNAPAFAIVGEPVHITLRIEDQGPVPADLQGRAVVHISTGEGESEDYRVKTNEDLTLPVTLAHGGANLLQFTVTPEKTELTGRNNTAIVTLNGVRDHLRVLLVSGEPYAGERTWRNLLKSDSSVELVHFTILRPPEKFDGVPVNELSLIAFPTRELFLEKIDEFDLIIFDRYRRRGILPSDYLENIVRYVRSGGALMVASGPAFAGAESLYRSPLSQILPARPTARVLEEPYLPKVSALGKRHPVTDTLEKFAADKAGAGNPLWGRWLRLVDMVTTKGDVVMTGPSDRPLLVLDRVGKGRIAMLASDHAWLWSRGYEGGGPQLELLRRLAHWMMQEPELEEEQLTATAKGQSVLVKRRSLLEEEQALSVEGPDGKKQELAVLSIGPGQWQAEFTGWENGVYSITHGALKIAVALGPAAPIEFENTLASGDEFRPLLTATGGGILRLQDWPEPALRLVRQGRSAVGRGWVGLTPRDAYVTRDIQQTPLLPAWLFLLISSLLIIAAWRKEGR